MIEVRSSQRLLDWLYTVILMIVPMKSMGMTLVYSVTTCMNAASMQKWDIIVQSALL